MKSIMTLEDKMFEALPDKVKQNVLDLRHEKSGIRSLAINTISDTIKTLNPDCHSYLFNHMWGRASDEDGSVRYSAVQMARRFFGNAQDINVPSQIKDDAYNFAVDHLFTDWDISVRDAVIRLMRSGCTNQDISLSRTLGRLDRNLNAWMPPSPVHIPQDRNNMTYELAHLAETTKGMVDGVKDRQPEFSFQGESLFVSEKIGIGRYPQRIVAVIPVLAGETYGVAVSSDDNNYRKGRLLGKDGMLDQIDAQIKESWPFTEKRRFFKKSKNFLEGAMTQSSLKVANAF